jgi:hypothetical protein
MSTKLSYNVSDEASVKKAFNTLMVKYANDKSAVLDLMDQNAIAVANADAWTTELKQDVEVMQDWVAGQQVYVGELRKYNDVRYVVVQSHVTQADWTPPQVPALFTVKPVPQPGQNYPDWIQPTGAQDAYALGERVHHNNLDWESQYAANVWEPGVFGWIQI